MPSQAASFMLLWAGRLVGRHVILGRNMPSSPVTLFLFSSALHAPLCQTGTGEFPSLLHPCMPACYPIPTSTHAHLPCPCMPLATPARASAHTHALPFYLSLFATAIYWRRALGAAARTRACCWRGRIVRRRRISRVRWRGAAICIPTWRHPASFHVYICVVDVALAQGGFAVPRSRALLGMGHFILNLPAAVLYENTHCCHFVHWWRDHNLSSALSSTNVLERAASFCGLLRIFSSFRHLPYSVLLRNMRPVNARLCLTVSPDGMSSTCNRHLSANAGRFGRTVIPIISHIFLLKPALVCDAPRTPLLWRWARLPYITPLSTLLIHNNHSKLWHWHQTCTVPAAAASGS